MNHGKIKSSKNKIQAYEVTKQILRYCFHVFIQIIYLLESKLIPNA